MAAFTQICAKISQIRLTALSQSTNKFILDISARLLYNIKIIFIL